MRSGSFPDVRMRKSHLLHLRQLSIVPERLRFNNFLCIEKTNKQKFEKHPRNSLNLQLLLYNVKKILIAFFWYVSFGPKVSEELQNRLFWWKPIWWHFCQFARETSTWLEGSKKEIHDECCRIRFRLQRGYHGGTVQIFLTVCNVRSWL